MDSGPVKAVDVAALTERGARLARRIAQGLARPARLRLPERIAAMEPGALPFTRLAEAARDAFHESRDLVCVMACGIVVRGISHLLQGKDRDPAVVVLDEEGRFAVSLLSGHMGGANLLAREVASITGGTPVITTATDTRGLPAFDILAQETGCRIENLAAVRSIHSALLEGRTVQVVDPVGVLCPRLAAHQDLFAFFDEIPEGGTGSQPTVYAGESPKHLPSDWLVLRPRTLVLGIGCNRGTGAQEILDLIHEVLDEADLSPLSVSLLASVSEKQDEPGILEAAQGLHAEIMWFPAVTLTAMSVPNPSETVRRHLGTPSVAEAAALAASRASRLLVPKRKAKNVTMAVARLCSTS